jgi:hypothetical protein
MLAADPDPKPRPQAVPCPTCGLTNRNCDRIRWLRGAKCCAACGHDPKGDTDAA